MVPEWLMDDGGRLMQNIFIADPTLSQYAATAALQNRTDIEAMRQAYDLRRSYLLNELPKLGFDVVIEPQGAFYIYANVSSLTNDSKSFCWNLLEQAGVAITPGEDFGSYRSGQHLRFSYATSLEDIHEGIKRIRNFL